MSFLTNIRKQILCLLTITFIFTASLLAQSGDDGEISKKGHLEAIKLIERVVDELPTHLRSDASPIIADLYNEYLTHFLGQNAAEADANTASSTLKMTGKVNKYFDDLVTLLKANGVTILDPKDLTPEMKKTIKSKLKDAVAESIEIDDNIKNLKNSKLGSGALYYIAEMTNGDLVALNIPSELDGAIKVAEGQYVITEEVFENYLGKQILESRGYAVAEGGLMVVMRSDKFTLENATPEGVRTAIEEQNNKYQDKSFKNIGRDRFKNGWREHTGNRSCKRRYSRL
jgi:hypothetical protein